MKRTPLVFLVTALLSVSAFCTAAEQKDFDRLDTNKDGQISREDHINKKLFDKLDTNKDGKLSKEELIKADLVIVTRKDGTKHLQHRDLVEEGEAAAITEEQRRLFFGHVDQDKDNYLNRKEWSRASPDGFVLWRF